MASRPLCDMAALTFPEQGVLGLEARAKCPLPYFKVLRFPLA